MKKADLQKIIREELQKLKELQEKDQPWVDENGDGWNIEYFEDTGLMDVLSGFDRLSYELNTAQRGAVILSGDHLQDVINFVQVSAQGLNDWVDEVTKFGDNLMEKNK